MERAVAWYHERLLEGPDARGAREYLRSRGITARSARQFKLGWAPDEWDALTNALKMNEKVLLATGLGFVNKRDRRQDALRARIIFPSLIPRERPLPSAEGFCRRPRNGPREATATSSPSTRTHPRPRSTPSVARSTP